MKHYIKMALLYAVLAMAGGVFYREFTKFNDFTAQTTLRAVHPHYFLLGMVFFLLLLLLEKNFAFTGVKTRRVLIAYHMGLNLTSIMLVVRGISQVLGLTISSGMDAAISGMAGIGHMVLGVSLVLLLVQIRHGVLAANA
ncbi:MAG: DUF2871 domain-containing protein [Lachnospiraceae bacterium]|jgi:hypothetical protein|nr:DUF2871 family protein [uncultured Acetatifactor sp.]MCI9220193.1 DUF2871 domain-containing protein [Lachnospiraceae bacterium]